MRTATVFFLLALLSVSMASKSSTGMFAEIEAHSVGNYLLSLVQINMQSNAQSDMSTEDSVSQIADLLNELQADMQNNKKVGDSNHEDFQDQAAQDISNYNQTLVNQLARKAATEAQLEKDESDKEDAEDDRDAAQQHLEDLADQIEDADEADISAKVVYAKKTSELAEAIQACKDAQVELAKLNLGSFVQGQQINMIQLKSGMQKIESALSKHMPSRLAIYKPIITALLSMGTNADPALVAKVVGLINELQNTLEAELSTTETAEEQRSADYEQLREDLVSDQDNTEDRVSRDNSLIASLISNIAANTDILEALNESIPATQQLLQLRIDQAAAEQESYESDDANRVSELDVIEQLINYTQEKWAQTSDYLKARVAQYDN